MYSSQLARAMPTSTTVPNTKKWIESVLGMHTLVKGGRVHRDRGNPVKGGRIHEGTCGLTITRGASRYDIVDLYFKGCASKV